MFKLHSPNNCIVGGGFFAYWTTLPLYLAWETFGQKNGAGSILDMQEKIQKFLKNKRLDLHDEIGCILLEMPFFLPRELWIPAPSDWAPNIVKGKGYDLNEGIGKNLWSQLQQTLHALNPIESTSQLVGLSAEDHQERYGKPLLQFPWLGQGSFRILVTEADNRRCAVTHEQVLPVLDAAHIKP